jgi:hypothetical protein
LTESLKKISIANQDVLLREIQEFEVQLQRCRIATWKDWFEYFQRALEEDA